MKEDFTDEMMEALVSFRIERARDTVQEAVDLLEKITIMLL